MKCRLCPRLCNVDRVNTLGFCNSNINPKLAKVQVHFGEEPIISGTRGSGTIFFSGCSLQCIYCQNNAISCVNVGREVTPQGLVEDIKKLEGQGVHNINFVTPTHHADTIIRALNIYPCKLPIVYNTSGYERTEMISILNDYVDVYLTDFKYSDNSLSLSLSNTGDYKETSLKALQAMVNAKKIEFKDDMLTQGVIVRHLILPQHINNTLGVLEILSTTQDMQNMPIAPQIILSLMSQYTPNNNLDLEHHNLNCTVKKVEQKLAQSHAQKIPFYDIFVQNLDSATDEYLPQWDI